MRLGLIGELSSASSSASAARPPLLGGAQLARSRRRDRHEARCGRPARGARGCCRRRRVGTSTCCGALLVAVDHVRHLRVAEPTEPEAEVERRAAARRPGRHGPSAGRGCAGRRARGRRAACRGPSPLKKHGTRRCSAAARNASQAPSQYTSLPTMNAGRSALAMRSASCGDRVRHRASAPQADALVDGGELARGRGAEHVEREVEERRPAVRRDARAARPRAPSRRPATASFTVAAVFVMDCITGTWSNSCSEPLPQRASGARPPSTTSGEPLNHADVMADTPLVMPGPAVSAANPGLRVSLA